jgi:hypothetical protein
MLNAQTIHGLVDFLKKQLKIKCTNDQTDQGYGDHRDVVIMGCCDQGA